MALIFSELRPAFGKSIALAVKPSGWVGRFLKKLPTKILFFHEKTSDVVHLRKSAAIHADPVGRTAISVLLIAATAID